MTTTPPPWNPGDYATVAERVRLFYAAHPMGRIITRLESRSPRQVTFVAQVYRNAEDVHAAATGWASEREGDGDVNTVACLENAETSAVGRALANLGFSASRQRASREEMERATRYRPRTPVRPPRDGAPASPTARAQSVGDREAAFDAQQDHANAVRDAFVAVAAAERAGLPTADIERHRRVLSARSVAPSEIARIERELRAWMHARFPDDSTDDRPAPPMPTGDDATDVSSP